MRGTDCRRGNGTVAAAELLTSKPHLETALRALPSEGAGLILEYYRYEGRRQIERRKDLAQSLGLRRDALANRVQRLRDKLEHCVSLCLKKR